MLRGSAWMIALRWSLRLVGIVSTFILAHLLTPDDFGVVAMAMLFVGLVEALGDTGERLALVRLSAPGRHHYDTAFTLQLLVGLLIAAVIFLAAPLTAAYFHDARAIPAMRCLSLRALLAGLENIASVDFRKDLRFGTLYRFNLRAKAVSFVVTIALALVWRNYWALIGGILAGQAALTILSYLMHPYRPRLSLAARREIVGFSAWTLARAAGLYLTGQVDQLAVGGIANASAMGRYTVAADVAASPTAEINEPMVSVLYPVMSRINRDPAALRRLYLQALGWSAAICAATSVGVALVAQDYAWVVLGPNWQHLEALIGWLALAAGLLGLTSGADTLFDTIGRPRRSAALHWTRLGLLALAVAAAALATRNIVWVAAARMLVNLVFLPLLLGQVAKTIGLSWRDCAATLWRPAIAAAIMAVSLLALGAVLPIGSLARLVIEVPAGAAIYLAALLLLWRASGRPESCEKDLLHFLRSLRPASKPASRIAADENAIATGSENL
jgi:O-antigen/teichoic acid export membrane protein